MAPKLGQAKVKGSAHPAKQDESANLSIDAFAGAKAGGKVALSAYWENPETELSWSELASLAAEGDAAVGVGFDGEFEIKYSPEKGKFLVHAKAALVCGPGLSGAFTVVVYAEHILSFVQFVYHKIMSLNYAYIGFIEEQAFKQLVDLLTHYMFNLDTELEHYIGKAMEDISGWWGDLLRIFERDDNYFKIEQLADNILQRPSRLKFTPPEVKGRFLYMLTELSLIKEIEAEAKVNAVEGLPLFERLLGEAKHQRQTFIAQRLRKFETAILVILSLIQSKADYQNVLQHMSLQVSEKTDIEASEKRLYNSLGIYGRAQMKKLKIFKEIVDDEDKEVIYPDKPPIGKPVHPNAAILHLIQQTETTAL